jgi:serine protease Do
VTSDLAESLKLKRPVGVIITEIYSTGPADEAGLRIGDVVISVNGRAVEDTHALRFRVATLKVGGSAELAVVRKGKPMKMRLALRPAPEDPPRQLTVLKGSHPLAGATVANMSPALAEELSLGRFQSGVIVISVARRSNARNINIQPGDHVARVNDAVVTSVDGLTKLLGRRAARWNITVRRGSQVLSIVIGG